MSEAEEAVLASLASLRQAGAYRADAARFHYLEVMAQRMQSQPASVRNIVCNRLREALADYMERLTVRSKAVAADVGTPSTHLTTLNRYIQDRTPHVDDMDNRGPYAIPPMKSARRFSETWSRIAAENQLDQALGRGPKNAGPLNSHMLVLRSLAVMRELSPDYLRRFLAHAESLLSLEQLNQKYAPTEAKPTKRTRQKK